MLDAEELMSKEQENVQNIAAQQMNLENPDFSISQTENLENIEGVGVPSPFFPEVAPPPGSLASPSSATKAPSTTQVNVTGASHTDASAAIGGVGSKVDPLTLGQLGAPSANSDPVIDIKKDDEKGERIYLII